MVANCISGLSAEMIWKKAGDIGVGARRVREAVDARLEARATNVVTETMHFMVLIVCCLGCYRSRSDNDEGECSRSSLSSISAYI